jgi:hypothetical protein
MPAANTARVQEHDSPGLVPHTRLRVVREDVRPLRAAPEVHEQPTRLLGRERELQALQAATSHSHCLLPDASAARANDTCPDALAKRVRPHHQRLRQYSEGATP